MSAEKYIGGAFAKDDSNSFRRTDTSGFFQSELNVEGFETGADAIAWLLLMELKERDLPVYFPKHYCGETLGRIRLKVPRLRVKRYSSTQEINCDCALVIWNHFNGYCPVPSELVNGKCIVFEDCVQSLEALHRQVGKASFTSLRKWLELDLALVVSPYERKGSVSKHSAYYSRKKEAEQLKFQWKQGNAVAESAFLNKFAEAEKALQTAEISFHSTEELEKYEWNAILERRRENAEGLLEFLVSEGIRVIGAAELFVMIQLENRDEIRKHLAQNGIFAPVHWLDSSDDILARTLLSLPIDQRYDREDMQRVANAVRSVL